MMTINHLAAGSFVYGELTILTTKEEWEINSNKNAVTVLSVFFSTVVATVLHTRNVNYMAQSAGTRILHTRPSWKSRWIHIACCSESRIKRDDTKVPSPPPFFSRPAVHTTPPSAIPAPAIRTPYMIPPWAGNSTILPSRYDPSWWSIFTRLTLFGRF